MTEKLRLTGIRLDTVEKGVKWLGFRFSNNASLKIPVKSGMTTHELICGIQQAIDLIKEIEYMSNLGYETNEKTDAES